MKAAEASPTTTGTLSSSPPTAATPGPTLIPALPSQAPVVTLPATSPACFRPPPTGGTRAGVSLPPTTALFTYVYAQQGAGADPADVFYIRSTDGGVTFSAPFKLNTDTTTRPQWQPNLSASPVAASSPSGMTRARAPVAPRVTRRSVLQDVGAQVHRQRRDLAV